MLIRLMDLEKAKKVGPVFESLYKMSMDGLYLINSEIFGRWYDNVTSQNDPIWDFNEDEEQVEVGRFLTYRIWDDENKDCWYIPFWFVEELYRDKED